MNYTHIVIWGLVVFSLVGVFFGIFLAFTARKFHVPSNPLIDEVRENLPSANCGACGYAGCQSYAEAVVEKQEVQPTLCVPGGKDVAESLAKLTSKAMGEIKDFVAVLRCYGTTAMAHNHAEYVGIKTCSAATLTFGGPKACKNGCLGLGDCERVCPFDAIHIKELGIAQVDVAKCTGCGMCAAVCPKSVIEMYPRKHRVELACVAKNKASFVRATCLVGCVTCQKCTKACPAGAVTWDGKTIIIDHVKCVEYGPDCHEACSDICPTHVMHRLGQLPIPQLNEKPTA